MRKLSSLILSCMITLSLWSQTSPHGAGFKVNCMDCHSTSGWAIDFKTLTFNHGTTKFPLTGQHFSVSCRACHTSLEFGQAGSDCIDCHTDMHNQTVGPDCARCHTPNSWVVTNITEMHQRSRFPLIGAHASADCFGCHTNATSTMLDFQPLGIECFSCHQQDYNSAKNPDHVAGNYSQNCYECHSLASFTWTGAMANHDFFPLTQGHALSCLECHKTPDYSNTSPECISCHQDDYAATSNPNHSALAFSTVCTTCHTTNPGWKPAEYRDHDAKSFPIYSGKHNGEWTLCSDCHTNPASYSQFTCIDCHEHNKTDMDGEHEGVQGYIYNSPDCLACHPTGSAEGSFNHSLSVFPLTGAHATTECIKCHSMGYSGTPDDCYSCHTPDYNQSVNPDHTASALPTTCETCHSTTAWSPATFNHDNIYPLTGAHAAITGNCIDCHQGNYTNTPNTCFGCHQDDFNQTTNPPHTAAQFPVTCTDCHSQTAWTPSNWNHDGQYFPIYSGKHQGEWNTCADCHTNPANYTVFSCIDCHEHNQTEMDQEYDEVNGYAYNSAACYSCHPTGNSGKMMNRIDKQGLPVR